MRLAWERLGDQGRIFLVCLLTGFVFSRAFTAGYLNWDDQRLILDNAYLRMPFGLAMRGIWTTYIVGDYAPLQHLSYWLEIHAFGLSPHVQHAVNWALHLVNVGLLFHWLRRRRIGPFALWFGVLIFAIHPLQVEPVLWLSDRKGLLNGFFVLLALLFYERSIWLYTLFFGLACFCKASAALLPLVILLSEGLPIRRQAGALAIASFSIASRVLAQSSMVGDPTAILLSPEHWLKVPESVLVAYGHYLLTFLWPFHLSAIYPDYAHTPAAGLKAGLAIAFLTAWAWRTFWLERDRDRTESYFGLWFLLLLLPVMNIVPRGIFVNDRYLYLPIIGVTIWVARVVPKSRITAWVAGAWIVVLAGASFTRSEVWEGSISLWQDAARKNPGSQTVWNNLAMAQLDAGEETEAARSLETALGIQDDPVTPVAVIYNNLGRIYLEPRHAARDPQRARRYFERGLELAGRTEDILVLRYNAAMAMQLLGRGAQARSELGALMHDIEARGLAAEYPALVQRIRNQMQVH